MTLINPRDFATPGVVRRVLDTIDNPKAAAIAALWATAVAGLGGAATRLGPWYYNLERPPWQPPDWIFGPMWTTIFTLIAVSGYKAWQQAESAGQRRTLLWVFAVNSVLNIAWSVLFFALQRPDWSLIEHPFLWGTIAVQMLVVWPRRRLAFWLLAPYLLWVAFAGVLNWAIVDLNGPFS